MQVTEDLIRSVVQQVLSQMGPSASNGSARPAGGNLGVYPTADAAVSASEAAFQKFRSRPLADRETAIDLIKSICVDNADELGRKELEGNQGRPT